MARGIVVTTDNRVFVQDFSEPLYKTVGKAVGGWIEIVHPRGLKNPFLFICNEEGLLEDLPVNLIGSALYGTPVHGYPIVGNIVFLKESGEDLVSLIDEDIYYIVGRIHQAADLHGIDLEDET